MSEEYEDKPSLYKALRGLISGEEFVNPYRFGETSFAQNPKKFIDRSSPDYQESIYAEPTELPSMDTGGIAGEIRGIAPGLKKIVRKAMQNEMKARGVNPFEASTLSLNQRAWKTAGGAPEEATFEGALDKLPSKLSYHVEDIMSSFEEPIGIGHMLSEAHDNIVKGELTSKEYKQIRAAFEPLMLDKPIQESNVTSRLLRGTWYRGQSEYPSNARIDTAIDAATGVETPAFVTKQFGREYGTDAPVFAGLRTKSSNLGEPHGISLSYDPHVSTGFRAPATITEDEVKMVSGMIKEDFLPKNIKERVSRLADTQKVARVMPLYGGPPEGKILQAWKPEHGKEFREAYVESAREMAEKYPGFRKSVETLNPGASGEEIKNAIGKVRNEVYAYKGASGKTVAVPEKQGYDIKYQSPSDELNSLMSKKLMERGWKGMLHSPHRFQEYELRMFDPYDALYIDKRAVNSNKYSSNPMSSKAVRRLDEMKSALKREHETVTEGKPKSLRDWYTDITREEILGLPKTEKQLKTEDFWNKVDQVQGKNKLPNTDMPDDWEDETNKLLDKLIQKGY